MSSRELWLVFSPFPLLWLGMGIFVDPAVFKFWGPTPDLSKLTAMTLGFIPLCFTLIYGTVILAMRQSGQVFNAKTVFAIAAFAAFVSRIMVPLP